MIRQFLSGKFLAFLITGGIAALVNLASRIVYDVWTSFSTAVVLAYLTGMVTAFVLARLFVFRETRQSLRLSAGWFVLVNFVAILQTWGLSMFLAFVVFPWLGIERFAREAAHAIGVVVPVFTSYLGHKYYSFR
ncbi:GtrA family protein [Halopseudomonas salina]|uniref:GtrA/DPMS transmembrane domain-containing protein n=1 Tax=Halopseudomonas salina TaxID=1323744 RepID=A0ABQ1PWH9_9GAMM|nr:GtrA family protein [Halopseudomonas salina]GGD04792.1 hypothetical protein GCM10007418_24810 [Halopseudomonas salina]